MEPKKAELRKIDSRVVINRAGGAGKGEIFVKKCRPLVTRLTSSDLMYSMVMIAKNTVLYTGKLVREKILNVFTTHTQR